MPVDYYELTLVGSHVNFSLSVCMIDQLQQMVSYKHMVPEGNYTAASITAVDLCGQRSEPPEVILTNITMDLLLVSNVPTSDTEQSQVIAVGAGLGVTYIGCGNNRNGCFNYHCNNISFICTQSQK